MNDLARTCLRPAATAVFASSLVLGAGSAVAQTDQANGLDLTNAPVDMHEGTCANPTLDP